MTAALGEDANRAYLSNRAEHEFTWILVGAREEVRDQPPPTTTHRRPATPLSNCQSESELDSMLRLLPRYAEHVSRRRGSLITHFFGIYRIASASTGR